MTGNRYILLAWFLFLAVGRAPAEGPRYDNSAARYSLKLPEGWKLMPPTQLDEYMKFLEKNGQKQEFVAGFQLSDRKDFQYPYILVQQFQLDTPSYAEIQKMLESQYPPGAASPPKVDKNRKTIACTIELDTVGIGKEKRLTVMCLGKKAVTCLRFFALASEYPKNSRDFDAILDSFQFDDGYEFDDGQAASPGDGHVHDRPGSPGSAKADASKRGAPVFQYFIATLATVLILFTICKPSHRR